MQRWPLAVPLWARTRWKSSRGDEDGAHTRECRSRVRRRGGADCPVAGPEIDFGLAFCGWHVSAGSGERLNGIGEGREGRFNLPRCHPLTALETGGDGLATQCMAAVQLKLWPRQLSGV